MCIYARVRVCVPAPACILVHSVVRVNVQATLSSANRHPHTRAPIPSRPILARVSPGSARLLPPSLSPSLSVLSRRLSAVSHSRHESTVAAEQSRRRLARTRQRSHNGN